MNNPWKPFHLKHVEILDFRSIKNAHIGFTPGLNIIIGKNASGKTNLLTSINNILSFESLPDALEYQYNFLFQQEGATYALTGSRSLEFSPLNDGSDAEQAYLDEQVSLLKNNKPLITGKDALNQAYEHLKIKEHFYRNYYISYKNWENIPLLTTPLKFEIQRKLPFILTSDSTTEITESYFIQNIIAELNFHFYPIFIAKAGDINIPIPPFNNEILNEIFYKTTKSLKPVYDILSKLTPIKEIRIRDAYYYNWDARNNILTIDGLTIEFKFSDENWYTYSQLSDGTKRLFKIVSQLVSFKNISKFEFGSKSAYTHTVAQDENEIILLEEPELGIHPHQLNQLMTFLKEESETKQIIITTHSPVVLDILNKDELDRIIISEHTPEKGSTFRHMTEEEKAEAQDYMKDLGYLSYYWRFSDFNRI